MQTFKTFAQNEQDVLNEKLITFGGKAYPKFNQVVIMAGGAGSGKGFTQGKLMGIEGVTLDVDRVKELAMGSTKLKDRIKKETGKDISKFNLKNPKDVGQLHVLLSDVYRTTKGMDKRVFNGIMTADPRRKPNLIFDVTLKDMGKMAKLAKQAQDLGYAKEDIHIVWVMNDIKVAMKQNKERSRTVPENILIGTHAGAALTFKNLMAMGAGARTWADGDWWITFAKADIDTKFVGSANPASEGEGGVFKGKTGKKAGYMMDATYIKVKAKGKAPEKASNLDQKIIKKISDYTPNAETWGMLMKESYISDAFDDLCDDLSDLSESANKKVLTPKMIKSIGALLDKMMKSPKGKGKITKDDLLKGMMKKAHESGNSEVALAFGEYRADHLPKGRGNK